MKECYNRYEEMHITGLELRRLFKDSFYCTGRHHETTTSLPIPTFLKVLNIKECKVYRVFYNEYFCKILNEKTDEDIAFFGHRRSSFSKFFNENDWEIPKCPLCNSEMKLRVSQYGEFWGCSKYPNCKGKLQIGIIPNNLL